MSERAQQHGWIYAVLIEMNAYCRNEGLGEVSAALEQAIRRFEPVLFAAPRPRQGPALPPRRPGPGAGGGPGAKSATGPSAKSAIGTDSVLPFPTRPA